MLDTGIDIPECVNLVFFKIVRSHTKFLQMLGRGTRLCPGLFGPDGDKEGFRVFDLCGNFEYFEHTPNIAEPGAPQSLTQRYFEQGVRLLKKMTAGSEQYDQLADRLAQAVAGIDAGAALSGRDLELIERFKNAAEWQTAPEGQEIADLALLPSALAGEPEEAKRFDILIMEAQARLLGNEPLDSHQTRIREIAKALQSQASIPAIAQELDLILELQADSWWEDVTYGMLENARRRLRTLMSLLDTAHRTVVFTDFEDELGESKVITLPQTATAEPKINLDAFDFKATAFLRDNLHLSPIDKVHDGVQLTGDDIEQLAVVFEAAGLGDRDAVEEVLSRLNLGQQVEAILEDAGRTGEQATDAVVGLGLYMRARVGLSEAVVRSRFEEALDPESREGTKSTFVENMIDDLVHKGTLRMSGLFVGIYRDLSPQGDLFADSELLRIQEVLAGLNMTAVPIERGTDP